MILAHRPGVGLGAGSKPYWELGEDGGGIAVSGAVVKSAVVVVSGLCHKHSDCRVLLIECSLSAAELPHSTKRTLSGPPAELVCVSKSRMVRNHGTFRLRMQPWPYKSFPTSSNSGKSVLKKEIPDEHSPRIFVQFCPARSTRFGCCRPTCDCSEGSWHSGAPSDDSSRENLF